MTISGYNTYKYANLYSSLTASSTTATTYPFSSSTSATSPFSSSVTSQSQLASATRALNNLDVAQKTQVSTAVKDVRNSFKQLAVEADKLNVSKAGNVFDKRGTLTSDATVLTAKGEDKATISSYSIEVNQLAKANETTSDALKAKATTSITAGSNTFSVTVGEKTTKISVDIEASDTNEIALKKMSKAVNDANAGVSANVVKDSKNGTAKIVLTAAQTGTENAFSLTAGSGNILDATNATKETVAAQNSKYVVNGQSFEDKTNNIKLDNGKVSVTLKKTTEANTPVKLSVTQDVSAVSSQVASFVKQYNSTVNTLSDNSGLINSSVLKDLTSYAGGNRAKLSDIGVTVNSDKTITLDTKKLEKALTTDFDNTKNLLGGAGGLASSVGGKANSVNTVSFGSLVDNMATAKTLDSAKAQVSQQIKEYLYNSSMDMINYSSKTSGTLFSTLI